MKNLDKLPLSLEEIKELRKSFGKMLAMGIKIQVVEISDKKATVSVEQVFLSNSWILNRSELKTRAKDIFQNIKGLKINYIVSVSQSDFKFVTKDWIESKMEEFGLKQVDVGVNFGIDKSTISHLLGDTKAVLTRFQKSAFYYYFLTFEINKNMRKYIKQLEMEIDK